MSTFGGVMEEFPDIRVDYFRQIRTKPGQKPVPPALAGFLSHVHTDHLTGLDSISFRAPFIYCSAATKELLLRLEKYPHRLNFALGILEAQKVQFKHLKNLLRPIPLETPTRIELSPGNEIQVTLFDANHCTGAVMFLFEGNGKAVLYTGDIRSEPWFVSNLTRNPFLIEYTCGLKTLDCIYLDTSNTADIPFPTKAAGLKELLEKVSQYPPDTVFHFEAWTFGYEEVWMALSKALKSPIHVDRYKLKLYQSLRGESAGPKIKTVSGDNSDSFHSHEGPVLAGYKCGNTPQMGCLTSDTEVRLHSCEKGMHCSAINEKTVWIRPIITRRGEEEVPEIGVGGGGGDLNQHPDLVFSDTTAIDEIMSLFTDIDDTVKTEVKRIFSAGLRSTGRAIPLDGMDFDRDENELSLTQMAKIMAQSMIKKRQCSRTAETVHHNGQNLPKYITFPYSRHSSYQELCDLVRAFKPKDVYPCTVDEDTWNREGISISFLFGHECSSANFRHDREMAEIFPEQPSQIQFSQRTQFTTSQSSQAQTSSPEVTRHSEDASNSLDESILRERIRAVKQILPSLSILTVRNALLACNGSLDDSVSLLCGEKLPVAGQTVTPGPKSHGPTVTYQRNAQGRIRPFDAEGKELHITSETLNKATPPREIIALSPGSESQSLRRKAIVEEFGGDKKRPRLHFDELGSSPPETPLMGMSIPSNLELVFESLGAPQDPDSPGTPGSEDEGDGSQGNDGSDSGHALVAFDSNDQIYRCTLCASEVWGGLSGFCTGCEQGINKMPYYEVLDQSHWSHFRPDIAMDEYTDTGLEDEERLDVVGDVLDDEFSAYDSQDETQHSFNEEYEQNSFIDDTSSDAESEEGSPSSSDGEDDYRVKFQELQASHDTLTTNYRHLESEFREFRMDIMGSDFDEDDDEDEERDEYGMLLVVPQEPKITTTEIILSSVDELSDELGEGISERRMMDRAEAFDAVNGTNGLSWHDISLLSTSNNHTFPEVEL